MRSLSLAKFELRRMLTGRRIVAIAVAVVTLVPLLYGALYLWAFWDPYSRVSDIPVALVNADVAVRSGDTTISAGADLKAKLLDAGTLGWRVMSAAEASAALRDHSVYMAVTVPRDFSARLATADSAHPTSATIVLTADEADSMLASQIGQRVLAEVRSSAAESASRTYFDSMWVALGDARDGFSTAASGAVALRDGLVTARDGSLALRDGLAAASGGVRTLASGLMALDSGAATLRTGAAVVDAGASTLSGKLAAASAGAAGVDAGARSVASGAGSLSEGLSTLASSDAALNAAAGQVAGGAAQVSDGIGAAIAQVGAAADGSAQLAGASAQVAGALKAYAAAHPEAASDPTFAAALAGAGQVAGGASSLASQLAAAGASGASLADGAKQLATGASALAGGLTSYTGGVADARAGAGRLVTGATTLAGGTTQLAGGMTLAAAGAHDLASGTARLSAGATQVAGGAASARTGAGTLSSGLGTLSAGSRTLAGGLGTAVSGSRELASGLSAAVATMPNDPQALTDAKSAMMSDPVALETVKRTQIVNYGTGFAAYFVPLALWVGALVIFFLLKPVSGRGLLSPAPDHIVALSGYWPAALLGSLQAVVMMLVVQFSLGLTMTSPLLTYGIAVLAALTFVALVQWLSLMLGSAPGKLAGIVVLMLQLTSAGGTFPIETTPAFFRAIHAWLPMTYVVDGLRQTIAGGDMTVVAHSALALAGFLALGLAGTLVTVHRHRALTMDRLHPALVL